MRNPDWHLRFDVASPLIPRLSPPQKPSAAHRAQNSNLDSVLPKLRPVATFEFAGAGAKSGRNAEMNERPKLGSWDGGRGRLLLGPRTPDMRRLLASKTWRVGAPCPFPPLIYACVRRRSSATTSLKTIRCCCSSGGSPRSAACKPAAAVQFLTGDLTIRYRLHLSGNCSFCVEAAPSEPMKG
jgi:hypothetical protein